MVELRLLVVREDIQFMGTKGTSTGVHLDFQILKNDTNVDPGPYIGL